jgi:hypothetical protein
MANIDPHDLDRALDEALAKYAVVEPRSGLENRVIANLRAERARVPQRVWWRWSVAGAVAAVIVVLLAWRSLSGQRIANHPSNSAPAISAAGVEATGLGGELEVAKDDAHPLAPGPSEKIVRGRWHATAVTSAIPKLDRFPSPQPLSEQEKLLENYVAKYPERAVLLARARLEALQRDQLEEMNPFPSGDRTTDLKERDNDTTER